MFTQSMPQLAQALSGVLPDDALRQLMQALGNCQQPLTHRGDVNLQPQTSLGIGGVTRKGAWNPGSYQNLLPPAGSGGYVDIPSPGSGTGNGGGSTTGSSSNYGGSQFAFPINQGFNYSNYYGGNTFNVAGNSNFQNITTNQITLTGPGGGGISFSGGGFGVPSSPQSTAPSGGSGFNPGGGGDGGFFGGGVVGGGGLFINFPRPFPGMPGGPGFDRGANDGGQPRFDRLGKVSVPVAKRGSLTGSSGRAVNLQGSVSVPVVTGATLNPDSCAIQLTVENQMVEVTVSGSVDVPTGVTIESEPQVFQVVAG